MDKYFGYLPTQLAALNQAHMAVHELMLDPLAAAVCSLEEIRSLFDEMYEAEREFIRAF